MYTELSSQGLPLSTRLPLSLLLLFFFFVFPVPSEYLFFIFSSFSFRFPCCTVPIVCSGKATAHDAFWTFMCPSIIVASSSRFYLRIHTHTHAANNINKKKRGGGGKQEREKRKTSNQREPFLFYSPRVLFSPSFPVRFTSIFFFCTWRLISKTIVSLWFRDIITFLFIFFFKFRNHNNRHTDCLRKSFRKNVNLFHTPAVGILQDIERY